LLLILKTITNFDEQAKYNNKFMKILWKTQEKIYTIYNYISKKALIIVIFLIGSSISSIYWLYLFKNPYELRTIFSIAASFLFLIIYMNKCPINFRFPKLIKKIAKIGSDYSFSLFVLHYTIFVVFVNFIGILNSYLLLIIAYTLSNLISIIFAKYTELRSSRFRNYLRNRFLKPNNPTSE
jgi:peptidoglycan/LPS O-acetylase OafA/YrhL